MINIVENYKKLFTSFVKNDFTGSESRESRSEDNEETSSEVKKAEILLSEIKEDGKLNGEDLSKIEKLEELFFAEKEGVFTETKEKISDTITEMLDAGYTFNNKDGYNSIIKMMIISGIKMEMPSYESIVNSEEGLEGKMSISYDGGDKVLVYSSDHENRNNKFGYISGGEFIKDTSISDFRFSFYDDLRNNNDISDLDIESIEDLIEAAEDAAEAKIIAEYEPKISSFHRNGRYRLSKADSEKRSELIESQNKDIELAKTKARNEIEGLAKNESLADIIKKIENPNQTKVETKYNSMEELLSAKGVEFQSELNEEEKAEVKAEPKAEIKKEKTRAELKKEIKAEAKAEVKNEKELAEKEKFEEADKYNEKRYSTLIERKIIQALVGTKVDGDFGENTFDKIVEKQIGFNFNERNQDGKIGGKTLAKLLPEEKDITIDGKKYEVSVGEKGELVYEEKVSVIEKVSEALKSGLEYLKEFLNLNDEILEITGINGETFDVEFNEKDGKFDIDTSIGDMVSDKEMNKIMVGLEGIDQIKTIDEAKAFVEYKKSVLEAKYNEFVLSRTIDRVNDSNSERRSSYTISTFENKDSEELDVKLVRNVSKNGDFKNILTVVSTEFGDGISDSDTEVVITSKDRDITAADIQKAVKESKSKYEKEYAKVALGEKLQPKTEKAGEDYEERNEKIEKSIEGIKFTAAEIKPKGINETKWLEWVSKFDSPSEITFDVNGFDDTKGATRINIDFDDNNRNEDYNSGLEVYGVINADQTLNEASFKKAITKKVEQAIKNMSKEDKKAA